MFELKKSLFQRETNSIRQEKCDFRCSVVKMNSNEAQTEAIVALQQQQQQQLQLQQSNLKTHEQLRVPSADYVDSEDEVDANKVNCWQPASCCRHSAMTRQKLELTRRRRRRRRRRGASQEKEEEEEEVEAEQAKSTEAEAKQDQVEMEMASFERRQESACSWPSSPNPIANTIFKLSTRPNSTKELLKRVQVEELELETSCKRRFMRPTTTSNNSSSSSSGNSNSNNNNNCLVSNYYYSLLVLVCLTTAATNLTPRYSNNLAKGFLAPSFLLACSAQVTTTSSSGKLHQTIHWLHRLELLI